MTFVNTANDKANANVNIITGSDHKLVREAIRRTNTNTFLTTDTM